jgi:hypothetical protein
MAKLYFLINDYMEATNSTKSSYSFFNIELENFRRERHNNNYNNYNIFNNFNNNQDKINLFAFLLFNHGKSLEILKKEKESRLIYKKGYEFSLSHLGEYNMITCKFIPKISYQRLSIYNI